MSVPVDSAAAPAPTVRHARPSDAATLARLMVEAISWGRLGELGPSFVRLLHRHMIGSRHGVCLVAEQNGNIVGYIAATTDTRLFYRDFLLKYGFLAAVLVLPVIWHPRRLQTVVRGLTHFPEAPKDDPAAEAISFAVESGLKTKGTGTLLFRALVGELRARHVPVIKFATVDADNIVGNSFYQRMGCTLVRTVPFYRNRLNNVYFYTIDSGV